MRAVIIALTIGLLSQPLLAVNRNDAEFGGACAYGLAALGTVVPTDCSVHWTDPKTGKTYCFSSEKAKQTFFENAEENLRKARAKGDELRKM